MSEDEGSFTDRERQELQMVFKLSPEQIVSISDEVIGITLDLAKTYKTPNDLAPNVFLAVRERFTVPDELNMACFFIGQVLDRYRTNRCLECGRHMSEEAQDHE